MSLDLDDRQRAMLHEMGVHVWWPAPPVAEPVPLAAVPAAVAPGALPVREVLHPTPAFSGHNASSEAIESIAMEAITAGARGPQGLKNEPQPHRVATQPAPADQPGGLPGDVATLDWPALTQTVANCQVCALATGRRAPVFGAADGLQRADWLLVGEPPDEAEERLGAPFADAAGQLLDNMLKAVGVSRRAGGDAAASAYATNAVKCRPANVRNPEPAELAVCEHYLRREVALVQPKVILAMGRFAAQALLQASHPELISTPLGKLRGRVYRYHDIPVVVTYHPSYLLRTQQDKARAWADLCLALAQRQA